MKEIWKIIDNFPNYQISNFGRVMSLAKKDKPLIMAPHIGGGGYYSVNLHRKVEGKKVIERKYIHRLVAEAFIPNPLNRTEINHIDGDKTNNHITNIEWITHSENMKHSYKLGLHSRCDIMGINHPRVKLSEEDVRDIRRRIDSGTKIGKEYGITRQQVNNIRRGKSWKHLDSNTASNL